MFTRRRFLQGSVLGGAAVALPTFTACAPTTPLSADGPFTHGVASGDPHDDSVVLWSRVNPRGRTGPVTVGWEVASDAQFSDTVRTGSFATDGSRDWTVKVVADGLDAATTYHYRFVDDGAVSPVGRTRTAPTGPSDRLRFGVASCSNYGYGNFHAYRHLARRADLDAVIHLGDYIYEYASDGYGETYGTARTLEPRTEILTVDDYRTRYGLYRLDPDLQELHRQHPMIHVWDDHEFADDPFIGGASNHQPADGDWAARVAAALQAYTEWMPTRIDGNRIHRTIEYGDLARIVTVDRQRRFLWPEADDGDLYLGRAQFDWLDDRIAETNQRWLLLAQATTFGATDPDLVTGGWGTRDRNRVLDAVAASPSDLVVLAGDIHRFHALDSVGDPARYDPRTGAGSGAVEFAVGSITSPGSDAFNPGPQMRWNSGFNRGYVVLDVTPDRVQADFWGFFDLAKLLARLPDETWLNGFATAAGSRRLSQAPGPAPG
jgi:alkaline phosphatase D